MKLFLSALDSNKDALEILLRKKVHFKYTLISFFYARKLAEPVLRSIIDNSDEIMVDSGAYSFQVKGKKVDWDQYTEEYCQFIRKIDCKKVIGFFEMDIDVLVGYEKVLQLRKKMLHATDKVIPVWHKNRGIADFKKMCAEYKGRLISISGLENRDVDERDYNKFYNYAHNAGCLMHCLGMTKVSILDRVPFDYVDSASWAMSAVYGKAGKKQCCSAFRRTNYADIKAASYILWQQKQQHYEWKYKNINKYEL